MKPKYTKYKVTVTLREVLLRTQKYEFEPGLSAH